MSKAAGLAALIKERLQLDARIERGTTGQFDVLIGDELVATRGGNWLTRRFGAGYPDPERVVDLLKGRFAREST